MKTEINPDAVRIDCRGVKIDGAVLEIEHEANIFQFVMDAALRQTTTFHAGLFINLQVLSEDTLVYPRDQRISALFESPINACYSDIPELQRRFDTIFTHQQNLLEQGPPFKPLMFGTNWVAVWTSADSRQILERHPVKTKNVSFMGNIQHNDTGAYSFRREVAEFAVSQPEIDCFGKGIREIDGKEEALAAYRFSIAMENASSDFYFSEKLIDCLLLETIPIYYGCPSIGDLIDPRGLLTFSTLSELNDVLRQATPEKFEEMRPFVLANKETVIRENWHSHPGLFRRLVEALPQDLAQKKPVALQRAGFLTRAGRSVRHLMSPLKK